MAPSTDRSAPFGRMLTAMVTPLTADGAVDYDGAAPAGRRTWSTTAQRRPRRQRHHRGVARPRATRRRSGCCARSSRRSATGPRSSPASAPTTPRHSVELARAGGEGRRRRRCWSSRPTTTSRRRTGLRAPLHGRRRRHRPAGDALRHPGPHAARRSRPRPCVRLAEHPRIVAVKDAKGDLRRRPQVHGRAPTSPTTPATTC